MRKILLQAISTSLLVFIFLGASTGIAISPQVEAMEFKVNVGDSKDYEMVKYYDTHPEEAALRVFSAEEYTKEDGSKVSVTVENGTEFSVTVTAINDSNVFGKITLEGHTLLERKITLRYLYLSSDGQFVMATTDNLTHWEQEVLDKTDESDPNDWTKAWLNGDIVYLEAYQKHLDNSIDHDKLGVNWKTGWIEYFYDKSTFSNESIVYEIEWKAVTLGKPTTEEKDSSGFEIISGIITLVIIAQITRRYSRG